jgi:hypothetical protein
VCAKRSPRVPKPKDKVRIVQNGLTRVLALGLEPRGAAARAAKARRESLQKAGA